MDAVFFHVNSIFRLICRSRTNLACRYQKRFPLVKMNVQRWRLRVFSSGIVNRADFGIKIGRSYKDTAYPLA